MILPLVANLLYLEEISMVLQLSARVSHAAKANVGAKDLSPLHG